MDSTGDDSTPLDGLHTLLFAMRARIKLGASTAPIKTRIDRFKNTHTAVSCKTSAMASSLLGFVLLVLVIAGIVVFVCWLVRLFACSFVWCVCVHARAIVCVCVCVCVLCVRVCACVCE